MKIAIIGDRGVPAQYSGFSTLVEELAVRLVRDHAMDVTVYCRRHYYDHRPPSYQGIHCVYLPAPGGKSFESIFHSTMSVLHAAADHYDLAFIVDPGNGPFSVPLVLSRVPIVFHTDGLGWQRTKWSPLQQRYYKWAERVTARLGTWLVTDSRAMQDYYRLEYGAGSSFIPYGSVVGAAPNDRCLEKYSLDKRGYYLVVARIEPENNTDLIIQEYRRSNVTRPLVVVGGARYESDFSRRIFTESDGNVRCLGTIYESDILNGLYKNCYLYLHGHEVGGTNPSLLRAMGTQAACAAINVVFHRQVLGEEAVFFDKAPGSLAEKLSSLDKDPERVRALGLSAGKTASTLYRWDAVGAGYAEIFRRIVRAKRKGRHFEGALSDEVYRPWEFVSQPAAPES